MRIGVLGGAFDPPHNAHLTIAGAVTDQLATDRVLFIPYARGPHRPEGPVASDLHRLEMVKRCTAPAGMFEADDRELRRGGISYTVDTLEELSAQHPAGELILIVGADQLATLSEWRNWRRILELALVAALPRPDHPLGSLPPEAAERVRIVDLPPLNLSSTLVRERIAAGRSIRYLVPAAVARYIEEHHLYR